MPEDKSKADARRVARQHTTQLLAILQGKTAVPAAPPENAPAPPPSRRPTAGEARAVPGGIAQGGDDPPKPIHRPSKLIAVDETLRRQRSAGLDDLVKKTLHLAQLNQVFRSILPAHLREHATLARLDEGGWVVQTDSSAWATRLRYALPELRKPLEQHLGIALPRPRIRIAPPAVPKAPPPPSRRMTVTAHTVSVLESAAHNVADLRLGAAILRLAEHARETRGDLR